MTHLERYSDCLDISVHNTHLRHFLISLSQNLASPLSNLSKFLLLLIKASMVMKEFDMRNFSNLLMVQERKWHHLLELMNLKTLTSYWQRQRYDHVQERLLEIQQAMIRLESGHFGRCVDCEQGIGRKRLARLPQTQRCLACQQKHERSLIMIE